MDTKWQLESWRIAYLQNAENESLRKRASGGHGALGGKTALCAEKKKRK